MAHTLHLERDNSSNLLPEEDEERRRVFYCIYCCDRWISFMLGKPYAINDININDQKEFIEIILSFKFKQTDDMCYMLKILIDAIKVYIVRSNINYLNS